MPRLKTRNADAREFVRLASRAKIRETDVAVIRRWTATNAPIAVDEITSKLKLPKRSLVIRRLPNGNEQLVSRHRLTAAAKRAATQIIAT